MKGRKRVAASELHDLITRGFRDSAGDLCLRCRIPMPVYFGGAREGPNWRLPPLEECSTMCHSIVEDLVAKLAATHDIRPPAGKG